MKNFDLIKMVFSNLWRRKVRSFLTILGVIIGTASIAIMVSLGIGMNENFKREISRMGSLNVITVDPYFMYDGPSPRSSKPKVLDDRLVATLKGIKGVSAVSPMMRQTAKFTNGSYIAYVELVGVDPNSMEDFDFNLSSGRLLSLKDTNTVVYGSNVKYNFYNPRSRNRFMGSGNSNVNLEKDKISMTFDLSYGEKVTPGAGSTENKKPATLYKVSTAGLLKESFSEKDSSTYMNINYLKKLVQENEKNLTQREKRMQQSGYQQILVKVGDLKDVEGIQQQIKDMGYGARSLGDILKSMQKTSGTIQLILGGIGAISLFISALGITNTMIMSIYERTREIGVMKVLGCRIKDIRRMFFFESGMIGLLGGCVGIALSFIVSIIINSISSKIAAGMYGDSAQGISVIPFWLAAGSILFAMLIGIVAGSYPARKAVKLSALEAIKTE